MINEKDISDHKTIKEAANFMTNLATSMQEIVIAEFHGIELATLPGGTPQQVCNYYDERIKKRDIL